MRCKNCKKELVNGKVKKSAEIPLKPNHHYIICPDCGNVMIARYIDGEICDEELGNRILPGLHSTPTNNSEETMKMMREAAELFKQAGSPVGSYSYKRNEAKKSISDLEEKEIDVRNSDEVLEEEDLVATEPETYTDKDINMDKEEVLESTEYTHPHVSTISKIKNWIKGLFKK